MYHLKLKHSMLGSVTIYNNAIYAIIYMCTSASIYTMFSKSLSGHLCNSYTTNFLCMHLRPDTIYIQHTHTYTHTHTHTNTHIYNMYKHIYIYIYIYIYICL